MDLSSNTILITGGSEGIGLALAERFLQAGSEVLICGRREELLQEAQAKHPRLKIQVCDVSKEAERITLLNWATSQFPNLNVLINNAGIQRRFQFTQDLEWGLVQQEIVTNFEAPVHLSMLFIKHLLKQQHPAIINVTSGLAFTPAAFAPVYSATKAALHSFTLSLRHQLSKTPIKVLEIVPPAVNTNLGGTGLHTTGVPLAEFADAVIKQIEDGELEITYGFSEKTSRASREELDEIFKRMNQALP
ncbi:MAG: SDR family NAD(P)-dependent oxidoreductase [Chloroflexi bacterium]|nr:SDR family NAD(P)-dependent oxidoreductase [Chloroflexota bacterium]